ncbi:MAG: PLDc_N domain-containing protein, partial [Lachnospiraceae bacterium]|nr:PLDc_N domain-containing protein [Lachnospiraceae bacterium]
MSGRVHTQEEKASAKNGILRVVFVVIAFVIEAILIAELFSFLGEYSGTIAILARVAAAILVIGIYSQKKSGSIKIPWIILIMAFPVIGVFLYLFIGLSGSTK